MQRCTVTMTYKMYVKWYIDVFFPGSFSRLYYSSENLGNYEIIFYSAKRKEWGIAIYQIYKKYSLQFGDNTRNSNKRSMLYVIDINFVSDISFVSLRVGFKFNMKNFAAVELLLKKGEVLPPNLFLPSRSTVSIIAFQCLHYCGSAPQIFLI